MGERSCSRDFPVTVQTEPWNKSSVPHAYLTRRLLDALAGVERERCERGRTHYRARILDRLDNTAKIGGRITHRKSEIEVEARLVARETLPFAHRKLIRVLRNPDGTLIRGGKWGDRR